MKGKVQGLHHIGIKVKNAEASAKFYQELLEFELTNDFRNGESHLMFLRAGSCVLELIERKDIAPLPAGHIDHVALTVENIEKMVERLREHNVEFVTPEIGYAHWIFGGVKNVFFLGPDGERIELFEVVG